MTHNLGRFRTAEPVGVVEVRDCTERHRRRQPIAGVGEALVDTTGMAVPR